MNKNLSCEELPVNILDRQVKKFRIKEVSCIKIWRNHLVEGAKWEAEVDMKSRYRHRFSFTPKQS